MQLSEDDLKLLRVIAGSNKLGLPCAPETVKAAKSLVDRGFVTITESGDTIVTDETKWRLFSSGTTF